MTLKALAGSPASARATLLLARVAGSLRMDTTLAAAGPGFVHTTRVSKLGLLVYETSERIVLGADGRSLRMSGEQRPRVGPAEPYEATGVIDETATCAEYRIPWMGAEMVQSTAVVQEGLELRQETPWSRGYVLLARDVEA